MTKSEKTKIRNWQIFKPRGAIAHIRHGIPEDIYKDMPQFVKDGLNAYITMLENHLNSAKKNKRNILRVSRPKLVIYDDIESTHEI